MGKPVEKKKKKGRPSLLDIQKRSLRLQKQQEEQQQQQERNHNPSPNPYVQFPKPPPGRRPTSRNLIQEPDPTSAAEEDDDEEPGERMKAKKLKLVLHLPHPSANSSDLASSDESDGTANKKRKIDAVEKNKSKNYGFEVTESPQVSLREGETSDLGPATPMPDKKLLEFILDRLQKKDTYGVFSEPVDPEELPDYHDIIEHPMDFGTVRKRLFCGDYKNLEQFEKDVFLISSNAMRYNSSDTIYFRQARSIHELAKKSFENLRQESEDSDPEPKMVRRGRPPGTGKNNVKRPVGRPPSERAGPEFSPQPSLSKAINGNLSSSSKIDLSRKGTPFDKHGVSDISAKATQFFRSYEAYSFESEHKSERNENYSGSAWKGSSKYVKKLSEVDESRRITYEQDQLSSSMLELTVLTTLHEERKILVPVALHADYAYARSLARFAVNLGPIGWQIVAKRIEKVLSPGTNFGPGWVGESEAPQPSRPQLFSAPVLHPSSHSVISTTTRSNQYSESQELASKNSMPQEPYFTTSLPQSSISHIASGTSPHLSEAKSPSHIHQNSTIRPPANGLKIPFIPSLLP